jgi:methylglutaconyl-CoA hydratase/polyketide biosynthesis enoyl-CoA hydratase PksH
MELTDVSSPLRHTIVEGVCTVTLANAGDGNTLSPVLLASLTDVVRDAGRTDGCRVVVLRAEGPAFCRGMDLASVVSGGEEDARNSARAFQACLDELSGSPLPVVACVEGEAVGGGIGLAAACDIVIASTAATFKLPEVLIGLMPALVAPILLRRMSVGRLNYLALTSRTLDAAEAAREGLVDTVAQDVNAELHALQKRLLRSSPAAISAFKQYLRTLAGQPADAEAQPAEALLTLARQPGTLDGLRAFASGHAPHWFAKGSRH